jgi:hypothetical protein
MEKRDSWVILRFEDVSVRADYVSVKGVYDSEAAAQSAFNRVATDSPTAIYKLYRSRRFSDENAANNQIKPSPPLVQGFKLEGPPQVPIEKALAMVGELREVLGHAPERISRQAFLPVLYRLAEMAVANALGGRFAEQNATWDINLEDGTRIEVKIALLDAEKRRAPVIQLRDDCEFDKLALVLFRPDLSIEAAKLIPREGVCLAAVPIGRQQSRSMSQVRVTSALLNFPGTEDIRLIA